MEKTYNFFGIRMNFLSIFMILGGVFIVLFALYAPDQRHPSKATEYITELHNGTTFSIRPTGTYTVQLAAYVPIPNYDLSGTSVSITKENPLGWPWEKKLGYVSEARSLTTPLRLSVASDNTVTIYVHSQHPFKIGMRSGLDTAMEVLVGISILLYAGLAVFLMYAVHVSLGGPRFRARSVVTG